MKRTNGSVCAPNVTDGASCSLGHCAGVDNPSANFAPCPTVPLSTTPAPTVKAKCTVKDNPNCPKLSDKFMSMLSDITDRVDDLKKEILRMDAECKKTQANLEAQIINLKKLETDTYAELALATKDYNENSMSSIQKTEEFHRITETLGTGTFTCNVNIASYETELCD